MADYETVRRLVRQRVDKLIREATATHQLDAAFEKHAEKIHFIPPQYRVLGGVLQAMNIRFGNFVEGLLADLATVDDGVRAHQHSGRKLTMSISPASDELVDRYITERQHPAAPADCSAAFLNLLREAFRHERRETGARIPIRKDVDLLFVTRDGRHVYSEIKYNDDHDTGKFVDIHRKFIKTYLALASTLEMFDSERFRPIVYYFNPAVRWGPVYVPANHILRGRALFDQYFSTPFEHVDRALREMSEDPDVISLFDGLTDDIQRRSRAGGV
jgi:hypothetical protein